jgi:hypothetical protein
MTHALPDRSFARALPRAAAGLACLLALTFGGPVLAGPVADAATGIEARLAAQDYVTALAGARDLLGQVWDQVPDIGFTQALLVTETAAGYGVYNPRPTDLYKKGEPIIIYAEPFGFAYGAPGEGLHSIGFAVDLQVLDAAGNELASVPNVTQLDLNSRYKNREFQANITYNLDGIAPGKYTLVTTLRDKNSEKSGSFRTDIEITE